MLAILRRFWYVPFIIASLCYLVFAFALVTDGYGVTLGVPLEDVLALFLHEWPRAILYTQTSFALLVTEALIWIVIGRTSPPWMRVLEAVFCGGIGGSVLIVSEASISSPFSVSIKQIHALVSAHTSAQSLFIHAFATQQILGFGFLLFGELLCILLFAWFTVLGMQYPSTTPSIAATLYARWKAGLKAHSPTN